MRKTSIAISIAAALTAQAFLGSTASSAAPAKGAKNRNLSSGPINSTAHFKYPNSTRGASTVLYDQSGTAGNGAAAMHDSYSSSYDSEGADDFVVGAEGWTVTGFNFQLSFSGSPSDPAGILYDVAVYPDSGGQPGSTATCSLPAQSGTLSAGLDSVSVMLSSPCVLSAGTYWVSFAPVFHYPPQGFFSTGGASDPAIGNEGVWENPLNGFGSGFTTWTPLSTVFTSGSMGPNYLFQVVGTAGGGGGGCTGPGICLTTTVGTDTSPGACGSAQTLDVSVGDQVNFCYTVVNNTGAALNYSTLSDNIDGEIFPLTNIPIADGDSYQYNRIVTAGSSETVNSTWTAQDVPPGYLAEVTSGGGGITDRIFCDGFDGVACSSGGDGGFVDITGDGTPLGLGDDESVGITMPFSFSFYGSTSNQICIDNNGFLLFNTTSCPTSGLYANESLPSASLPAAAILPMWDDFDSESGDVYYATRGTAPNRQFIVEWYNRVHYSGGSNSDGATFEVILDEATGKISFEYLDVDFTAGSSGDGTGGASATIGLQYDTTLSNQFSYNEPAVTDNSGIDWTATSPTVYTDTDTVTLNVGAPIIDVSPTSLSGTAPADGTSTVTLDIGNIGNRDLNWTLDEAAPDSHFPFGPRYVASMRTPGEPISSAIRRPSLHRDAKAGHYLQPQPNGLAAVPAYGMDIVSSSSSNFVSFDAAAPTTLTTVGNYPGLTFSGDFVADDFSKEYVIGYPSGTLQTVDTSTGAVTNVGGTGLGTNPRDLAWDATTNTLFGAVINSAGSGTDLYTYDPATGTPTRIGAISGSIGASGYAFVMGLAVDNNGLMYGIEIVSDTLIAIDKTTGAASTIGSVGFSAQYSQGMAFDPTSNTLYDVNGADSGVYTMDLTTGAGTYVGTAGGGSSLQVGAVGIALGHGPCSTPTDQPWMSVSPASGTTAPSGTTPVTVTLDGTGYTTGDTVDGTLCVRSNDAATPLVEVPVEMTVGSGGGGSIVDSGVLNYAVAQDTNGLYINWLTGDICSTATGGNCDDTAGAYDLNAYGATSLSFWWSGGVATTGNCVSNGTSCLVLASGDTVGPSSTLSHGNSTLFRAGSTGYYGFSFINANTSQTNYGYAKFTTTSPNGVPATLVQYWYDNSGAAITIP